MKTILTMLASALTVGTLSFTANGEPGPGSIPGAQSSSSAGTATSPRAELELRAPDASSPRKILRATDFGLAADGATDDGPAIHRLVQAAAKSPGPVELQFPSGKIIAVRSAEQRYVFCLNGLTNLTVDGGGCEFRLGPEVRFLRLTESGNITVRNLKIDFTPLPFVDGEVVALDAKSRQVDVRLFEPAHAAELGGPTRQDGEQDFFGMLWKPGPYDLVSQHLYVESVTPCGGTAQPGLVRVQVPPGHPFPDAGEFRKSNAWKVSLPVPGIAHRHGPGANIVIDGNENVTFQNIETWSAPWFAFGISRNSGALRFEQVNIRPKPGTTRLTSSWRDGFHVKGNRASLLFDHCVLAGMNDDAFNISTHCSRVTRVVSPTRLTVLQHYPLGFIPFRVGGVLRVMDPSGSRVLGEAQISTVSELAASGKNGRAHPVQLELATPIPGLETNAIAWETTSANPNSILRGCVIRNSCRFQTPVTLEHCDFAALAWFYGDKLEGPGPERVIIRDSILRRGRGNQKSAATFSGWAGKRPVPPASAQLPLREVILSHNEIYGAVTVREAEQLTLEGNTFHEGTLDLQQCRKVIRK